MQAQTPGFHELFSKNETYLKTKRYILLMLNQVANTSVSKIENQIIYSNSMNREDLSKMTKQQLIDMLLGKKQNTESVNQTVSVRPTASTNVGAVHKPKTLVQLAAEKLEQAIKRPASTTVRDKYMPTLPQSVCVTK